VTRSVPLQNDPNPLNRTITMMRRTISFPQLTEPWSPHTSSKSHPFSKADSTDTNVDDVPSPSFFRDTIPNVLYVYWRLFAEGIFTHRIVLRVSINFSASQNADRRVIPHSWNCATMAPITRTNRRLNGSDCVIFKSWTRD
jgi:hypothetical protein